ncbi:unnamed protein product, partial [marine sediment metagenome]
KTKLKKRIRKNQWEAKFENLFGVVPLIASWGVDMGKSVDRELSKKIGTPQWVKAQTQI